jgi:very-short-patch-repair endonuclease
MTPYNSDYLSPAEDERLSIEDFAKHLRANPTRAEVAILPAMLQRGFFFQQICGNYVVDFFNPELLIAVEVDGWSHRGQARKDQQRENDLLSGVYLVIRIPDGLTAQKRQDICLGILDRMLTLVREARAAGVYLTGVWKMEMERQARTECRRGNESIYPRILSRLSQVKEATT